MQAFVPLKNSDQNVRILENYEEFWRHETYYTRTSTVSPTGGFLFRGLKRLNFSLKVLIKTGPFMWVTTVSRNVIIHTGNQPKEIICICCI